MIRLVKFIDAKYSFIERKYGTAGAAIIFALFLFTIAIIWIHPIVSYSHFGIIYAQLSQNPFPFNEPNHLQYRILLPLLGYLINIPYNLFFIIPWFFLLTFFASVIYIYRHRGYSPSETIAMVSLVVFSATTSITLMSPGYTDAASFLFIFLCFAFVSKPLWFILFFMLGLFNHENIIFFWPAMAVFYWLNSNRKLVKLAEFIGLTSIAVLPYAAFRYYIMQNVVVDLDVDYYFSGENLRNNLLNLRRLIPLGFFFAFKLLWFFPFVFIYCHFRKKKFTEALPVVLIIAGAGLQLVIAYDITRLITFGFMAILLSAEWFREYKGSRYFRLFIFSLLIFNLLVPQYFVSNIGAHPQYPLILHNIFGR